MIKSTSPVDNDTSIEGNHDAVGVKLGKFDSACEGTSVNSEIPALEAVKVPLVVLLKLSPSRKRRTPADGPMSARKTVAYPPETKQWWMRTMISSWSLKWIEKTYCHHRLRR